MDRGLKPEPSLLLLCRAAISYNAIGKMNTLLDFEYSAVSYG